MKSLPVWTIGTIGAALLIAPLPALSAILVYDRTAILQGELWRLWTGHLVHFSASHLLLNVTALALAGSLVEMRSESPRLVLFLGMPLAISLALLILEPAMSRYGGLSGLATGLLIYVALILSRERGITRFLGGAILAFFLTKTIYEHHCAQPLFAQDLKGEIQVATLSHLAGSAFALTAFLSKRVYLRLLRALL